MYKYAVTYSIFDGISNIYLISIATAFLAVIIAFYCSNLLKDENETQINHVNEMVGLNSDFEEMEDNDVHGNTMESQSYELKKALRKRLKANNRDSRSNCDDENNRYVTGRCNSTSTDENSDIDYDTDEMQLDGLVSKLKSKRVKDLEAQLTKDQLEEEKRIEREQLAAIFDLLKKQEAQLNMREIDERELNAQLALYR